MSNGQGFLTAEAGDIIMKELKRLGKQMGRMEQRLESIESRLDKMEGEFQKLRADLVDDIKEVLAEQFSDV